MGSAIGNAEATLILNARFVQGSAPYSAPAGNSVSLHTGDPGPSETPANEVTGGGYARQVAVFSASTAGGPVSNSAAITFPNMPAVTVSWFQVQATSAAVAAGPVMNPGTFVRTQTRAALATPVTLTVGQSLTIAQGALTVAMA